MAFRLRHWIGAFLAGAALATAWAVPPRGLDAVFWGFEFRSRGPATPERQERERLRTALTLANTELVRVRLADSLLTRTLEAPPGSISVGTPDIPGGPAAERRLREALAAEEVVPSDVATAVHLVPAGAAGHDTWSAFWRPPGGVEYYYGSAGDRPYCVTVRWAWATPDGLRGARGYDAETAPLGLCRWIRRYGIPTGELARWLEGHGASFASSARPWPLDVHDAPPTGWTRRLFGMTAEPYSRPGQYREGCLAGRAGACLGLLREGPDPDLANPFLFGGGMSGHYREVVLARTPVSAVEDRWVSRQDHHLLASLEDEFGPERFRAFWQGSGSLEDRFLAAFGVPMGEWLVTWYAGDTGTQPTGPALSRAGLFGGLMTLALFGIAGALLHRRWRAEA